MSFAYSLASPIPTHRIHNLLGRLLPGQQKARPLDQSPPLRVNQIERTVPVVAVELIVGTVSNQCQIGMHANYLQKSQCSQLAIIRNIPDAAPECLS